MDRERDPGDALEDVAGIHPALDRLRRLVASATLFDLKATADGYWAGRPGEKPAPIPPKEPGR